MSADEWSMPYHQVAVPKFSEVRWFSPLNQLFERLRARIETSNQEEVFADYLVRYQLRSI